MRDRSARRFRQNQAIQDRALLIAVGSAIVFGILGLGWLAQQIGTTVMTYLAIGGVLLVGGLLYLVVSKLREKGLRPPSWKELQQMEQPAEAAPPPVADPIERP